MLIKEYISDDQGEFIVFFIFMIFKHIIVWQNKMCWNQIKNMDILFSHSKISFLDILFELHDW